MDSDDDIQPLIHYKGNSSREPLYLELTTQLINIDPDFEQVRTSFILYRSKRLNY